VLTRDKILKKTEISLKTTWKATQNNTDYSCRRDKINCKYYITYIININCVFNVALVDDDDFTLELGSCLWRAPRIGRTDWLMTCSCRNVTNPSPCYYVGFWCLHWSIFVCLPCFNYLSHVLALYRPCVIMHSLLAKTIPEAKQWPIRSSAVVLHVPIPSVEV